MIQIQLAGIGIFIALCSPLAAAVAGVRALELASPFVDDAILQRGLEVPPLTWVSYTGMQDAKGFEKERDERNLDYPKTDACKAAVAAHIGTVQRPFLYAHPSAQLVDGIGTPKIEGSVRLTLDEWPKSLQAIASQLGAEAKKLK